VALCPRCGEPLEPLPLIRPLPAVAGIVAALGLAWGALPDRSGTLAALEVLPLQLSEVLLAQGPAPPRPGEVGLGTANLDELLNQLEQADQLWRPRAEPLPGGNVRYVYRRRSTDPPLTVEQVRALMRNPPRFERERASIAGLIRQLERVGVRVVLGPPRKKGAAGEWEPLARTIRIKPDVVEKGSEEFARVLNHEAIHVAQSCRRGALAARPQLLGLSIALDPAAQRHLNDPVYDRVSPLERSLEEEAYGAQHQLELGASLVGSECRRRR
jgi:hypothetical protein